MYVRLIAAAVATTLLLPVAPVSAGSDDFWRAVNIGVPLIREGIRANERAQERKRQQEAAERERRRVAELKKTKKGRAQLAREERAWRKRQRQQAAVVRALIGAVGADIVGGGPSDNSDDAYRQTCRPSPDQRYC